MENNKLQDPFFKQVLKKHLNRLRKKHGIPLNIIPDEERKTDKATRIEANLEPMDRDGNLIFNEQEKDSSDMKELVDQFPDVRASPFRIPRTGRTAWREGTGP